MRWSIGLVGERLFTGGRLGNGGRLRFGNRLIFESVADDSCANSTGRFNVLREGSHATQRASRKGQSYCRGNGRTTCKKWSFSCSKHVLPLGSRSQGSSPKCCSSNSFRTIAKENEQAVPRLKEKTFAILGNSLFTRMGNTVILVLSRRTSVPETKQGLRQA